MPPSRDHRWLLAIVVFCIYSFKLILLPIGEAGIRFDDLLIIAGMAALAFSGKLSRVPVSPALKIYLAFLCCGLLSSLWNGLQGRVGTIYSVVFVARQAEYVSFFYFGYYLRARYRQLNRAILIYTFVLVLVVPGQMLHIVPTPSLFAASRASGNTNGPYELAAVAAFLLCYLGYRERRKLSAAAALAFVVLSAARITFVGTAISLFTSLLFRSKHRVLMLAAGGVVAVLAAFASLILPQFITFGSADDSSVLLASRFAGSGLPIDELSSFYRSAPVYRTSDDYAADTYLDSIVMASGDSGGADVSGMIRVYRWTTLIKTALADTQSIILGVGPSFGTAAIDGYFVRALVETGTVGLVLFIAFLLVLYTTTPSRLWPFREYVVILAVTACFIDIFVAYKPMLLLWLWHGLNQNSPEEDTHAYRLSDASGRAG